MRCSLLADPHAVSCKVELFGNSLALIAAAHKYSTNRSFLCSASRSCQTRHGNTDVCSGCFAGALCHFSGTFGGNCPLLLQSTLLHSQTFMLGLVTVSHKAIAKHLRRTRYIDNALEEAVIDLLKEKDLKLSLAESLTGGMIAQRIVNVSGASEVFSS